MKSKRIKISNENWEMVRKNSDFIIDKSGEILFKVLKKMDDEGYNGIGSKTSNIYGRFVKKSFINFRDVLNKINNDTRKFDNEILLSISDLKKLKHQTSVAKVKFKEDTAIMLKKTNFNLEDDFSKNVLRDINNIVALLEQYEQMIQEIINTKE